MENFTVSSPSKDQAVVNRQGCTDKIVEKTVQEELNLGTLHKNIFIYFWANKCVVLGNMFFCHFETASQILVPGNSSNISFVKLPRMIQNHQIGSLV